MFSIFINIQHAYLKKSIKIHKIELTCEEDKPNPEAMFSILLMLFSLKVTLHPGPNDIYRNVELQAVREENGNCHYYPYRLS